MVRVFAFKIASVDYRADSLSGKGGEEKLPETPPFPVPAISKTGLPQRHRCKETGRTGAG